MCIDEIAVPKFNLYPTLKRYLMVIDFSNIITKIAIIKLMSFHSKSRL